MKYEVLFRQQHQVTKPNVINAFVGFHYRSTQPTFIMGIQLDMILLYWFTFGDRFHSLGCGCSLVIYFGRKETAKQEFELTNSFPRTFRS